MTGDKEDSLRAGGYSLEHAESVNTQFCRLLADFRIKSLIDEIRTKIAAAHGMDKTGIMNRLKSVYMAAYADGDWGAAVAALDKLGKIFGIYEVDNKQKRYSVEDVEAIRARLAENGVDLSEPHKPVVRQLDNDKNVDNGLVEKK